MNKQLLQEARRYLILGYQQQMSGNLEQAVLNLNKSINLYPTAEAYTYLGWTFSFKYDYETAIELCKKAIQIDPTFGCPYNDIGAYLIEQNKYEESIIWFEKACLSTRYEYYHFPYFNLGKVYQRQCKFDKALTSYRASIEIKPDYREAIVALELLLASMN